MNSIQTKCAHDPPFFYLGKIRFGGRVFLGLLLTFKTGNHCVFSQIWVNNQKTCQFLPLEKQSQRSGGVGLIKSPSFFPAVCPASQGHSITHALVQTDLPKLGWVIKQQIRPSKKLLGWKKRRTTTTIGPEEKSYRLKRFSFLQSRRPWYPWTPPSLGPFLYSLKLLDRLSRRAVTWRAVAE